MVTIKQLAGLWRQTRPRGERKAVRKLLQLL